jgi:NDP-sugar pyrophosphorylase family protein
LHPKVLITCSGLGSRLGEITDFTNKSLVRIGTKAAISHIIDSYPSETEFVVTLGYFGSHVKQYLQIAHSNARLSFVDVCPYNGKGSSLVKSILCAKDAIGNEPFIFNACDTLSDHDTSFSRDKNAVWIYSNKKDRSQYRTIRTKAGFAKSILEKGESLHEDPVYIGKCYISDAEAFWSLAESLYLERSEDSSLSDCHVIQHMIQSSHDFLAIESSEWSDIGNLDELKKTRNRFLDSISVLEKHNESIFFIDENVVKFFSDPSIVEKRVKRASYLPKTTPKIADCSSNFMSYRFTEGTTVSRLKHLSPSLFSNLLSFAQDEMWSKKCSVIADTRLLCHKFYVEKTQKRALEYLSKRNMEDAASTINGKYVHSLSELLSLSVNFGILDGDFANFHGDFILENIIMSNQKFVMIDWRQDFAENIEHGDIYYDLAKLNHNLHFNHDVIKNNGYTVEFESDSSVFVDINCPYKTISLREELEKFCYNHGYSYKKVNVLTGIIWINMAPLHDQRLGDFLYNFGKLHLQRALES